MITKWGRWEYFEAIHEGYDFLIFDGGAQEIPLNRGDAHSWLEQMAIKQMIGKRDLLDLMYAFEYLNEHRTNLGRLVA